jgi:CPA2 family monovalent cation:H+ antiporter-2
VIPILASLPLLSARLVSPLSSPETTSNAASNAAVAAAAAKHATFDLLQYLPSWIHPFIAIVAVLLIYLLGRFTINPLFRLIADSKLQEIFTTAALGIVTVVAAFMVMVGLSPALGVFVAGVVLSESNYRHQLEADIAPFKGLFLGLFFMTIGASFDFEVLLSRPFFILSLGFGLVLVKMVAGIILGRIFRIERCDRLLYALALAQGGEFAFVILGEALTQGIISKEMMAILRIVVAISMMISPLLFFMYEKKLQAIAAKAEAKPRESDLIDETHPIIVAGFGRFGQMVVRLLASCGYRSTVLDFDPQHNETLKRFGWKVYYGDASRLDLLRVAGLDQARLMVIAIDDMETTVNLARTLKLHYPNLPLIVRARNRIAAYDLIDLGVKHIFRETFDTSLNAGETALKILGFRSYQAKRARLKFAEADNANLHKLAKLRKGDEKTFLSAAKSNELELSKLLRAELGHPDADALGDDGWDKA